MVRTAALLLALSGFAVLATLDLLSGELRTGAAGALLVIVNYLLLA